MIPDNNLTIKCINTTLDDYYTKPYFIDSIFIKTNIQKITSNDLLIFKLIANSEYDKLREMIENKTGNINAQDVDGDTPLHIAVFMCDYKSIKMLIENNCKVNVKDKYGQTALHRTCFNADIETNVKVLELFESIDDVSNSVFNETDDFGNTPFHLMLKCMIRNRTQLKVYHFDTINLLKKLTDGKLTNNENQTVGDLLKILYSLNNII